MSNVTITVHNKPSKFEYTVDNFVQERHLLTLDLSDSKNTRLTWEIFSKRKSLLFKVLNFEISVLLYSAKNT